MNYIGLGLVFVGLFFLGYSEISKNKLNIYNKRLNRYVILKERALLKLQWILLIINSIGLILFGIIVIIYNLDNLYVVAYPLLFHGINYLIVPISKNKQYIK